MGPNSLPLAVYRNSPCPLSPVTPSHCRCFGTRFMQQSMPTLVSVEYRNSTISTLLHIHRHGQRIGHITNLDNRYILGIVWQCIQISPEAWGCNSRDRDSHWGTDSYINTHRTHNCCTHPECFSHIRQHYATFVRIH